MKPNGTQGTYRAVSQNPQTEENEDPKKASSHESVVENGQNAKSSPAHSKEFQDDTGEDEKKPMSPLRKFCFVLSLLQCALFIIAFGWLIPCKIPRHNPKSHSQNWELNYYGENFVTNLAVTNSNHKPVAVVLGFSSLSNSSLYGVRAVNAFDGSSMWEISMLNKPLDVVCSSLDIDSDNMPDCLISDDAGQILAISGGDGEIIWYMHTHHKNLSPQSVSKPIIGSSCHGENAYVYVALKDSDGMYYLVSVLSLSGRIKEVYKLPECVAMPENMMWRNSKVEHDEIDTPQELVMSCANKAGNAIIYTINGDEFCKNGTSQSFHEMFFKLAIIDSAKFPLRMELLDTDEGHNLAVLTHDSKIKVYSEEKVEQPQFSAESDVLLKDFVVGHFTNNSLANIIVLASHESQNSNTLLLLDNTHSNVLRRVPLENGTATSISVVHNAFDSLDTVLVKVISEQSIHDNVNNTKVASSNIKHFEESYLILECFDTGSFRTVSEDFIATSCHEIDCTPKMFQTSSSAILADVDKDEKEELVYFTHKEVPSTLVQSTTLKLTRLSDPTSKSCKACHC